MSEGIIFHLWSFWEYKQGTIWPCSEWGELAVKRWWLSDCLIHNTPFGETLLFHTKFITLTYSCETEKTGQHEDGNTCVYITQNKLSNWSIDNEAVNMCARPLPTNRSLCQRSESNTNSHIYLLGYRNNLVLKAKHSCFSASLPPRPSVFLLFAQFLLESLQICSFAKENRQQASGFG